MPQVISTNIASLNAQRNLNKSQTALSTSLQRLSSGMRINSAKDDAAGLAISERFTAQVRGLNQAVRNSNDGISLAQTAEGALGEVTNNLQRIRELAVQSANATNSSSDRAAMQKEVSELIAEIDRVATQTNFNGVKLLDGSFTAQAFQVGANVGETISVNSIVDATKVGLGLTVGGAEVNGGVTTGALSDGQLEINGQNIGVTTDSAKAIAAAINGNVALDGSVRASASTEASMGAFATGGTIDNGDTYTLTVAGVAITTAAAAGGNGITAAMVDDAIAGGTVLDDLAAAGVTVSGTAAGGDLKFTDADGDNIVTSQAHSGDGTGGFTVGTARGKLTLESRGDIEVGGTSPAAAGLSAGTTNAVITNNVLSVATVDGANDVITAVDAALNTVNGSRATLGAIQNRFESVVASLQTSSESLSAARSRIQDTDFAAETANLTKVQILQQAGTAMLAQANQLPQNVLSLLR
ncbi:MAG TPA: flagellin [Hyphomicrobiales bacterium]|nr:flagellin [Hyphomicrobiales bacterium]